MEPHQVAEKQAHLARYQRIMNMGIDTFAIDKVLTEHEVAKGRGEFGALDVEGQPSVYFSTGKSLAEMTAEVTENNHAKGWYETERSFGEGIALLHSELSEALDTYREIGLKPRTRALRYGDELGKPDDVGSEFADVLIRLLDEASRCGIDLESEYERKMAYNRTRPHRHGGKAL